MKDFLFASPLLKVHLYLSHTSGLARNRAVGGPGWAQMGLNVYTVVFGSLTFKLRGEVTTSAAFLCLLSPFITSVYCDAD